MDTCVNTVHFYIVNTFLDGYTCKHCTLLHCQHFSQWLLLVFMVTEKLAHVKVEAPEVTQSEIGQKQKLRVVLDYINRMLQLPPVWNQQKWSVDSE